MRLRRRREPHMKLVRDNVPQLIREGGGNPATHIAGPLEYRRLLRLKLIEEVDEFLRTEDPAELADIQEVVLATAADLRIDRLRLEAIRLQKMTTHGGFAGRVVWSGNWPA